LFGAIAAQFAGFEKAERAIEVAQGIADPENRTAALTQVAVVLALRNEDDQARHALNAISDDADRAFALIAMSDAKEKNGDQEASLALLNEAATLVESVPQLSARALAYYELIVRLVRHGNTDKAVEFIRADLDTISSIRDESSRAIGLAQLHDVLELARVGSRLDLSQILGPLLART
jgi:hypothetical protein